MNFSSSFCLSNKIASLPRRQIHKRSELDGRFLVLDVIQTILLTFDLQRRMINGGHQQHGIWGDSWYTGQLTPATAHAFHARHAPQSKLSFRQFRQHRTESSSLSSAAASSRERRWTPTRGNAKIKMVRREICDTSATKYLFI